MSKGDIRRKPPISFAVNDKTPKELTDLLTQHPFFIEQYTKGNAPNPSKFARIGACLFVRMLQTKNQKALTAAKELFERSCDIDLLLDCLMESKQLEVEAVS